MLRGQGQPSQQLPIRRIACGQFSLRQPLSSQPRHLAIPRDLWRIARDAIDPRVTNLARHDRQPLPIGLNRRRHITHCRRRDRRPGELRPQLRVDRRNLLCRVRPAVIVTHLHVDRQVRSRHPHHAAIVVPVIHHHQRSSGRILPQEHIRHLRRRARRVHADVQQPHARSLQRRDDPPRVPRHIRHLGTDRLLPEPRIQALRKAQCARDHRRVQGLRLPREGKRMPRNVALRDRRLHRRTLLGIRLLQVLVEQP